MKTIQLRTPVSSRWGTFPAGLVVLGGAILMVLMCYIYTLNSAVVDSLETQQVEKSIAFLQEDISRAEADLSRLSIGSDLEKRAMDQGLVRGGPGHFIPREVSVAQATR